MRRSCKRNLDPSLGEKSDECYLLSLAAKAAEQQLEEQALTAFPNHDRHETVHHNPLSRVTYLLPLQKEVYDLETVLEQDLDSIPPAIDWKDQDPLQLEQDIAGISQDQNDRERDDNTTIYYRLLCLHLWIALNVRRFLLSLQHLFSIPYDCCSGWVT